ncbi:MAG: hypothetical protein SH847_16310 [Roseiflexaceae bacterium]|nr:hypothetical protein [Roseiflexaceae bacterium]
MRKLIDACLPTRAWKLALLILGGAGVLLVIADSLLGFARIASLAPLILLAACAIPCLIPLALLRRRNPDHVVAPAHVVNSGSTTDCACGQDVG